MKNFISEDDIEQNILKMLEDKKYGYDILKCPSSLDMKENLNDGTNRKSKKECVLTEVLKESLYRINPTIAHEIIDNEIKNLLQDFSGVDIIDANYSLYKKLRENIKINIRKEDKEDFDFIKLIDFENPENNTFTAVSQMWIQGRYKYKRPDVLIFVNGLPLVFIELKNSIVKVEEAYNKNLKSYIEEVPNLFAFNQICVLSNGLETRIGAFNASYEFFFEWLKESENDKIDRKKIKNEELSIKCLIKGLLKKDKLIDYIENFILFENKRVKIIAKNHQFMGVNNLINSFNNRKKLHGKLGVFWHTQGSGKSYSMVMFARKIKRKIKGNHTFLIITDRDDLDSQIHKNFARTEVILNEEETQPKDSKQLREFLGQNKEFIFTLIHKFRYDKTKKYPVLSTRSDIIVLVDEAHRTEYNDLASNMRTALPNANFVAFTGTPLLGSTNLTYQWFGDYVSKYDFAQSVEDGSTVPLFYSRRVPEVGLQNNFLDDDILDVIEDEGLNEAESRLLENSQSKILEVIKRDCRLDKIAKDIAHHFPRRGFLGKGMVVCVDKFTAVKMYDKVQNYWAKEKQEFVKQRNSAKTEKERDEITKIINYMNDVEMAVVISDNGNDERFAKLGLDIQKHRDRMNFIDSEGRDIEDQFKEPNNKLQLVFVCAMWLTGFDVKNLSTLYLDKPMKSHTLMQTIARANRVYPNKSCGIIVDYVNVFKYMQDALKDYAVTGENTEIMPVKDIDKLIDNLNSVINEISEFLKLLGIDLDKILEESETLDQLDLFREAYNILIEKDANKEKFKVLSNTMINLYEASKPEIFEKRWYNNKFAPINYINGLFCNLIDDKKVEDARKKMQEILDISVVAEDVSSQEYVAKESKLIDLSKLDIRDVEKRIKQTQYKAVEINDLREYVERLLKQMINKNQNRIKFSERYKDIIDKYNSGRIENEDYYAKILKFIEDLQTEQERPLVEGLSESELEIYDLLVQDKNLTELEKNDVKLATRNLVKKLKEERMSLFFVDWYKDDVTIFNVKKEITNSLNADLPKSYDNVVFNEKIYLILSLFIDKSLQ